MFDLRIDHGLVARRDGEPRVASIGVRDGMIAAIGDLTGSDATQVIDADGALVVPGAIDTHVHLGFTDRDLEWSTETQMAAIGGITTPMIYFRDVGSYWETLPEFISAGTKNSHVDFAVHLGILNDNHLRDFDRLMPAFGIRSVKMYTTYKDGELAAFGIVGQDDGFILDVMRRAAARGDVVVNIHCENDDIVKRGERLWMDADAQPALQWSQARPPIAEVEAIRRVGLFARETGARIHLPHVSSEGALAAALQERALGANVSIETCPQYLRPQDAGERAALAKVNPPVRVDETGDRIWQAVGAGEVDTIGSDHACWCRSDKVAANISDVRPGFPGLGTVLPILMDGVINGRIAMSDYVRLNRRAAQVFDLPDLGQLEPGYAANIVIVDPSERTVDAANLGGTSDFTPFEGVRLAGWPITTILRGAVVADQGQIVGEPTGRYLRSHYQQMSGKEMYTS